MNIFEVISDLKLMKLKRITRYWDVLFNVKSVAVSLLILFMLFLINYDPSKSKCDHSLTTFSEIGMGKIIRKHFQESRQLGKVCPFLKHFTTSCTIIKI